MSASLVIKQNAHQPFGCSVSSAVSILVARGDWPQNQTLQREAAAADFQVMAAHQVLWDHEPAFNLALGRYLDGE